MPLKINVPYSEKDLAKEKGAFWDKDNKTWFVRVSGFPWLASFLLSV